MKKIILFLLLSILSLSASTKFLMPDEAFVPNVKLNDVMQIEAEIGLAKHMYLYEEALKLELKSSDGISIKEIKKSKSVKYHDSMVYQKSPNFLLTLQKDDSVQGIKTVTLELSYQGCSKQGLCYEPLKKSFKLKIDSSKLAKADKQELKSLNLPVATLHSENTKSDELSETDAIANSISSDSTIMIILTFLGFGFLLSLTPCVFPMIPIISGIIISQGNAITTKKAFSLSLVYVLAMAVAYTIAGVLAGLFGSNLQATLQTTWVIYSFSAVFVALAISMFGYYELKLPDSLVAKVSHSREKTGFVGVAIMGFLSALIVGPCVAAPLAGALVYIGQTGDALLGGIALFAMSIGMGIPLIAVGVSAGKFMPKPGAWMTMVSAIFGVMMLGVAIWMLEKVADRYIIMLLWSLLGIGFAIYLGVFKKEMHLVRKSVAVVMFIYSVALFLGALGGSTSMIKPLEFLKPSANLTVAQHVEHLKFKKVASLKELDVLLSENRGKKIMLDFSAQWCTACKELEEVTFADERVKSKISKFVLIRADVTQNTQEQKDLSKKYGVFGPPAILFFDKDSKVKKSKTIIGFIEPDKFLQHLENIF